MNYKQTDFDKELQVMLEEGKPLCYTRVRVIAKDLHDRVVKTDDNRMPMACNAMWKLWEEQGSRKYRIIHTTDSGQSTTIEIEFHIVY